MTRVSEGEKANIDKRVSDLLSRMTLEEKIGQMSVRMASGEEPAAAAAANNRAQKEAMEKCRHGIPLLLTRETSHGLNTAAVTCFPACIAMASTWDEDLNYRIGRAIAKEARAQGVHQGLSPVLDISRDPRWGRQEETLGEDPTLVSRLGVAFIKGLQSDDLRGGVVATAKHLVGYGASEGGKDNDPISITERDLHETYLPPFEAAFRDARAESVMICFGALNGVPVTLDPRIVTDLLKKWGFDGHVVDDCPGIQGLIGHRAAADMKEAIALGINAGNDRQFYDFIGIAPSQAAGQEMFEKMLLELVREGKVTEARINDAAARVLRSKFRLGLFEETIVDEARASETANSPAHRALAREAAARGIVLLKNDGLLPLGAGVKTIALIGPNAAVGQIGDYSGVPAHIVSPLEGIKAAAPANMEILHARGCEILSPELVVGRFSVRLTGNLKVEAEGEYELALESNDGGRLLIDGVKLIEDWLPGPRRGRTVKWHASRGAHPLAIEYFRGTRGLTTEGDAADLNRSVLRLSWSTGGAEPRLIGTDNFTYKLEGAVQQHGSGEGLLMEVFLGTNFEQKLPEQTRVVRDVSFDWNDRSPILAQQSRDAEAETIREAVETARRADLVILCVGETSHRGAQQVCGEHFDRVNLGLTGQQEELARQVLAAGRPTVLLLINGRALAIAPLILSAGAVLEAWYPGQEGGHAIADVLFGTVNPSGKLPVSIPWSAAQLPIYFGRRPRMGYYIDGPSEPLFHFGFGLSYTKFEYANLTIKPPRGTKRRRFKISVEITNTGQCAGDEVVQLYVEDVICSFVTPVKRLVDFKRVSLAAGEMEEISFDLPARKLAALDANMRPRIEAGEFKLTVGGSSAGGVSGSIWIDG